MNKPIVKFNPDKKYQGKAIQNSLIDASIKYQKDWDKINDKFFEYIEKATGYKLSYDFYYCNIDPLIYAMVDWGKNKITISPHENQYAYRKILMYEISLTHVFDILNKNKPNLSEKQKWAISECFAFALNDYQKVKNMFLPVKPKKEFKQNFYPELCNLTKAVVDIFKVGDNFEEAIDYISNNIDKFFVGSKKCYS